MSSANRAVMTALVASLLGCATGPSADRPDHDELCRERGRQVRALIDKADTWCLHDADCALFMPPTNCFRSCGVAIRADAVDALNEELQRAEIEICSADGVQCVPSYPPPPCLLPQATCYDGGCTLR